MKTPKQVLQDWVSAYNARDPHALIELYHDDAENHQVAFGDPLRGREALLESFVTFFQAFPDNYTHVENLFEDGEWAILEWRDPQGLRGYGFFHVRNGQIVFQRGYWDKLSFLRLHGIETPPNPSGLQGT